MSIWPCPARGRAAWTRRRRAQPRFFAGVDAGKHTIDPVISNFKNKYAVDWLPFIGRKWTDAADTAIPLDGKSPGAQQLRRSVLDYASSNKFSPAARLTIEQVRALWTGGKAATGQSAERAFDPDLDDDEALRRSGRARDAGPGVRQWRS